MSSINPAQTHKNNHLEALRGIAASLVLLGHMLTAFPELTRRKGHFTNLIGNWGTESVIIFFILSGIVMNASIQHRHRSTKRFLLERLIRIHPILIITLISCLIIEKYVFNTLPDLATVLGNIIPLGTLQGNIVPIFWKTNSPMWSLSFEVFFYVVFAIFAIRAVKLNQINMVIWLGLSLIGIYFYHHPFTDHGVMSYLIIMLAYSASWIVGFYIWEFRHKFNSSFALGMLSLCCLPIVSRAHFTSNYFDPGRNLIFALCSIPFFLFLIQDKSKQNIPRNTNLWLFSFIIIPYFTALFFIYDDPTYAMSIKAMYILCPTAVLPLIFFKQFIIKCYYNYIGNFLVKLGSISYALYLTHNPLLVLLASFSFIPIIIRIILFFPLIYGVAYLLEKKLQPVFNTLLKRSNIR